MAAIGSALPMIGVIPMLNPWIPGIGMLVSESRLHGLVLCWLAYLCHATVQNFAVLTYALLWQGTYMYLKMKTDQYTNPTARTLLLGTCATFGGMTLTPALLTYSSMSPAVVPVAFGLTCLLFGGSTLGALMMPKRSLMFLAPVLGGGALMIFGISIMSAFYPSPILTNVWLYGGLALATAFVAYDTQNAIQGYDGPTCSAPQNCYCRTAVIDN